MTHLILTGATGLIGSSVLSHVLAQSSSPISRLTILSRNPNIPLLAHPPPPGTPSANKTTQIEVIEHHDFASYPPELLAKLQGASACIWALGISQNDVDAETYVAITRDYALAAAKAFAPLPTTEKPTTLDPQNSNSKSTSTSTPTSKSDAKPNSTSKFKFLYVSGEGATTAPKPWTPIFGRVKGDTEASLLALSKTKPYDAQLAVYSLRPAAVDGSRQPWIWEENLRRRPLWYKAAAPVLFRAFKVAWAAQHSPTEELSRVLVELALGDGAPVSGKGVEGEGRTIGNVALRRLGGI